eukprot:CAMPEP_0197730738 /NCGR_PEP_ID=MMETSP1434-20131217/35383_1 /TAXON_ID=265543 /ORGANISM="Minutocellus polymorphus, Strain CCMP3303" /LENGTH=67 /DNA_ID=CAMNT_0043317623 /DNA_START=80 /DNA_END=283 /DNA_ORIENTATION=-
MIRYYFGNVVTLNTGNANYLSNACRRAQHFGDAILQDSEQYGKHQITPAVAVDKPPPNNTSKLDPPF